MDVNNLNQLIIEGAWEKLKDNPEYQDLPSEKKIIVAKQTINNKLDEADSFFKETIKDDLESARAIHAKLIKPLRNLIKALNACYAGGLDKEEKEQINYLLDIKS